MTGRVIRPAIDRQTVETMRPGSRLAVNFGGCVAEPDAQAEARKALHDQLLEAHPVRLGPIEWRHYAPSEAEAMLRMADLLEHPDAAGLLAWLAETPNSELVIAMVVVPETDA